MDSGKITSIRHDSELRHHFGRLIAQEKTIPWKPHPLAQGGAPIGLQLNFDGHQLTLIPKFVLAPTADDIVSLTVDEKPKTLLVVPKLTPALLETCRKYHVSAIDLNGRVFLRAQGLLVDRGPLPGREFRYELEPRNIFVGKSARIARTLLTNPKQLWSQAEIVQRTGASSGLVSRICAHLLRQGIIRKADARRFHVVSTAQLLDAWAEADNFARRVTTQRYSALSGDPIELAKKLWLALGTAADAPKLAFTQWIAAWLRHPYTEPPVVSAYISELPAPELLEKAGLRPVTDAGRVWFHLPSDEGVFLEQQTVQDLPLVTDAQIYIDLLNTGLRGPEQAEVLREWDGFCRP